MGPRRIARLPPAARLPLVDTSAQAAGDRTGLQRRPHPGRAARPVAVAAADPAVAVRRGPGRPGHRRRPPAGLRARPGQRRVDHPRDGRLGLDVLHRRPAQPAHRRAGGGPRVRQGARRRFPHRPGHLLRDRRCAGRADHRQGGAAGGDRLAAHLPRYRDRVGHPDLGRRRLRDQPGRAADGRRGGHEPRHGRVPRRHDRGADRRPQHPRRRPADRRRGGQGPPPAGLHHRLRHRATSPMVCAPDQISGDAAFRGDGRGGPPAASVAVGAGCSRSTRPR